MAGAKIKSFAIEDVSIDLFTMVNFLSIIEIMKHILSEMPPVDASYEWTFILPEIALVWTTDFTTRPVANVEDN